MNNIKISEYTSGAISLSGVVTLFSINNSSFTSVGTGNNGGAIYLNVSAFIDNGNSWIRNSNIGTCSSYNGGGIYIESSGISIYNVNFTENVASGLGNDIFFNSSSSQTFYTSTTFELCCSYSNETRFGLSDQSNLDNLLPHCGTIQGDRYVSSSSSSYDTMNTCLNTNNPCRSLGTAVSRGVDAGETVVIIAVIGEYDDVGSTISGGVFVHIHSETDEFQSFFCFNNMKKKYFFFFFF
jgi:hypothetical protein